MEAIGVLCLVTALILTLILAAGVLGYYAGRQSATATGFKAPRCEDRALLERVLRDPRQPPLARRIAKNQLQRLKRQGK